jgi:hypothetical protein
MATKRKAKRYDGEDGSMVESDDMDQPVAAAASARRSISDYQTQKPDSSDSSGSGTTRTPMQSQSDSGSDSQPQTFGAAFKAARASGDKTFTYNGKSYTTELASDKKPAASSSSSKSSDTSSTSSAKKSDTSSSSSTSSKKSDSDSTPAKRVGVTSPDVVGPVRADLTRRSSSVLRPLTQAEKDADAKADAADKAARERGLKAKMPEKSKFTGMGSLKFAKGGPIRSSSSKRGDGIATKGFTKGKYC